MHPPWFDGKRNLAYYVALMERTALITGATDGIGRCLALELAAQGHTVHVLGRNRPRGEHVLDELPAIADRAHTFFQADLSTLRGNAQFLDRYLGRHTRLDLLVLNANTHPRPIEISEDGPDTTFMVSCVSRYLFSARLDAPLAIAGGARVMHIGGATMVADIDYRKLDSPKHGHLKAAAMGFLGSCYIARFSNQLGLTGVPHEYMEPGVVNTHSVKNESAAIRFLARFMGLIEPEECARAIAGHLRATEGQDSSGRFFALGKEKPPKRKIADGEQRYCELLDYLKRLTGVGFPA